MRRNLFANEAGNRLAEQIMFRFEDSTFSAHSISSSFKRALRAAGFDGLSAGSGVLPHSK
jgi:hypothetical protein